MIKELSDGTADTMENGSKDDDETYVLHSSPNPNNDPPHERTDLPSPSLTSFPLALVLTYALTAKPNPSCSSLVPLLSMASPR